MGLSIVAAAAALLTVPLLGGHLARIGRWRFRWPWLPALALALQVLVLSVLDLSKGVSAAIHVASYVPLAVVLAANRGMPGLGLLVAGLVMNSVAIIANGGVMPADPDAMERAGIEAGDGFENSGAVEDPNLLWLGDVFAIPEGWPFANVFSVGDVTLVLGVFVLGHRQGESRLGRLLGAPKERAEPVVA